MTAAVLQFLACAAIIVVAGTFLAKFADQIAEITGFGRLLVGSVLLAGATSLPELTVDISAVRMGQTDLAVGDLFGSSLMNLLILAVLDLSHHSRGKMLSRAAAGHALSGAMSIALTALAGLAVITGKKLPAWSMGNLSPAALLIGVAYCLGVRAVFLDQRMSARSAVEENPALAHSPVIPLWKPILGFAVAAVVILVSGPWLAEAAGKIADQSGLGGTFVGTTFVAFCTSLPEFVASLAALRMGAYDLAVGNVFGSNTFNMVLLPILDCFSPEPIFSQVAPEHVISCLAAIMATGVAVMGQLYQIENRSRLIEPDALLMIVLILGGLALVYFCGAGH